MTTADMAGVAGILLAAGSSQRFGADKQSVQIDGRSMLQRAAHLLLDAGFVEPVVVLGLRAAEHRKQLAGLPLRLVENPAAGTGMASSLVVALDALSACEAVVVTVCDQPAVTAAHLQTLAAHWRQTGSTIVASEYAGVRGVPALFAATHFAELRQLQGDRGAGPLLTTHSATAAVLPLPEGALDIDTPDDLADFRARVNR